MRFMHRDYDFLDTTRRAIARVADAWPSGAITLVEELPRGPLPGVGRRRAAFARHDAAPRERGEVHARRAATSACACARSPRATTSSAWPTPGPGVSPDRARPDLRAVLPGRRLGHARSTAASAWASPSRGASRAASAATCASSRPSNEVMEGVPPSRRGLLPDRGAARAPDVVLMQRRARPDAPSIYLDWNATTPPHPDVVARDARGRAARRGPTPRACTAPGRAAQGAGRGGARSGRRAGRASRARRRSSPRGAPRRTTSALLRPFVGKRSGALASRADSSIRRSRRPPSCSNAEASRGMAPGGELRTPRSGRRRPGRGRCRNLDRVSSRCQPVNHETGVIQPIGDVARRRAPPRRGAPRRRGAGGGQARARRVGGRRFGRGRRAQDPRARKGSARSRCAPASPCGRCCAGAPRSAACVRAPGRPGGGRRVRRGGRRATDGRCERYARLRSAPRRARSGGSRRSALEARPSADRFATAATRARLMSRNCPGPGGRATSWARRSTRRGVRLGG